MNRHPAALVFLVALCARVAWAFLTRDSIPISDAAWYVETARHLAATGEYAHAGAPTAYWPAGYPFFLSLFHHGLGNPLAAAKAAQILLSSLACSLVALLALRYGASRRAALAAGLALAAYPSAISLATVFFSETLFTVLILAGFRLGAAGTAAVSVPGAGLLLGLACHVRPVALVLVPLVFLPHLLSGKRLRYLAGTAGVLLLIAALALPWGLRNQRVFGKFAAYSTNGGVNLYIGHNPAATGGYVETPEMAALDSVANEAERSRRFGDLAVDYIASHPAREAGLFFLKLGRLLLPERESVYFSFVNHPENRDFPTAARLIAGLNNLAWLAMLGLFLLVPWWKRPPGTEGGFLPVAALAFWFQGLFYCLFFVAERYKFPGTPFLLVALAVSRLPPPLVSRAGLFYIFFALKNRRRP